MQIFKKMVPNNSVECIDLEINNLYLFYCIGDLVVRCIKSAAKGHLQNDIASKFANDGYYINTYKINSLDNYMTRLQKLFDQRINKYHNLNIHIYYGQIGKNNEFGYYITGNFEE